MFKSLHTNIVNFFSHRKIKIWKPKHYEAIPQYVRPTTRDPLEYKLRTKEQLDDEHKKNTPILACRIIYRYHNWAEGVYQDRNRKVKIQVDMKSMNLTKLQKERLIQLLGTRYTKNNGVMTLACEMYPTMEENATKAMEMAKELYLEAKRAP